MQLKNKYDFLIFGAGGMQGKIVLRDLIEKKYKVFASDLYQHHIDSLLKRFPSLHYDLLDLKDVPETISLIKKVKPAVVVNCAEADWNLNVYHACLQAKVNVVDLGSDIPMTKKQFAMDKTFKKNNLIAITGCGSTPGINNIMLSYAADFFDTIKSIEAGFCWNSNLQEFVAPFSIPSIVGEFIDLATLMKNGKWLKKSPEKTIIEKRRQEVGKNKCFLAAQHAEPYTFYYYYKDRGLKNIKFYAGFPDHSFYTIYNFIKLGLTKIEKIKINGGEIVPLDFLTEILRDIKPPKGYKENEVLWVYIKGKKDKRGKNIYMECITHTLRGWEDAGCNIDTGIPASIIAQMVRNKKINAWGSFAPEAIVPKESFFRKLRDKKMDIYMNDRLIN